MIRWPHAGALSPKCRSRSLLLINVTDGSVSENTDARSAASFHRTRFENSISDGKWVEEGEKKKKASPRKFVRAARLMPTVEAVESLWEMSACISRGIKENMQRKSQWKDKCVGTLWGTQKGKLSLGNNIKYIFTLNPWCIQSNFILCLQCHRGITLSLVKLLAVRVFVVPQCEGNRWLNLISDLLYLAARLWTGMRHWILRLRFNGNPPWKLTLYLFDPFSVISCIKSGGIDRIFFSLYIYI